MIKLPKEEGYPLLAIAFVIIVIVYTILNGKCKDERPVGGMNIESSATQPAPSANK